MLHRQACATAAGQRQQRVKEKKAQQSLFCAWRSRHKLSSLLSLCSLHLTIQRSNSNLAAMDHAMTSGAGAAEAAAMDTIPSPDIVSWTKQYDTAAPPDDAPAAASAATAAPPPPPVASPSLEEFARLEQAAQRQQLQQQQQQAAAAQAHTQQAHAGSTEGGAESKAAVVSPHRGGSGGVVRTADSAPLVTTASQFEFVDGVSAQHTIQQLFADVLDRTRKINAQVVNPEHTTSQHRTSAQAGDQQDREKQVDSHVMLTNGTCALCACCLRSLGDGSHGVCASDGQQELAAR